PFDLDLGTVVFDLTYNNITLGSGSGTDTRLVPGYNEITLKGVLVRQEGEVNLNKMGTLFSNYINGIETPVVAVGKSTTQSDGTEISWLSKGLQALQLRVPFKPSNGPISPIKSIDIGDLALQFSPDTAWNPSADVDR
ncbi:hypothetical protein MPER_16088, partial [Moniliophthora perniciosa FA553]